LPDDSTKRKWLTFTRIRADDYPWDPNTNPKVPEDDYDAEETSAEDEEYVVQETE